MVVVTLMVLHVQVRGGTGVMAMPDATTVKQKMGPECGEHYLESMCVCTIYIHLFGCILYSELFLLAKYTLLMSELYDKT